MAKTGEIVGVQYLRGIAAVAVVFYHAGTTAALPKYFGPTRWLSLFELGRFGVDLFFLISGFIICVVSLKGDGLAPAVAMSTYFERRAARILPLMWVAVASYAALQFVSTRSVDWGGVLRGLTLFPGEPAPDVLWTLRHEFIFYAIFAFSFLAPGRAAGLMAVWLALPIVLGVTGLLPEAASEASVSPLRLLVEPIHLEFGVGLLIAMLWLRRPDIRQVRVPGSPFLLSIILFGAALYGVRLSGLDHRTLAAVLMLILLLTPVFALGVWLRCPRGPLDRIGRALGDASFSIYLFHRHLLSPILKIWSRFLPGTSPLLVIVASAVLATLACIVIHGIVEKPLVRLVQTRLIHRPRRTVGV